MGRLFLASQIPITGIDNWSERKYQTINNFSEQYCTSS
jgi:hypothetical protein